MRRLIVLLALSACGASSEPPDSPTTLRVLFVGNSLTYANDLPGLLAELGESTGVRIEAQSVAVGGYALEDHWAAGSVLNTIATGHWDWVILQQGPSALPASRVNLLQWADSFNLRIREAGAQPALYQVWPAAGDSATNFSASLQSYALAAQHVNGRLLPAGTAWRNAWHVNPTLPLYDTDDFHPSMLGSYTAAITIYGSLTGRSPVGLPGSLAGYQLPPNQKQLVQQAAESALRP